MPEVLEDPIVKNSYENYTFETLFYLPRNRIVIYLIYEKMMTCHIF